MTNDLEERRQRIERIISDKGLRNLIFDFDNLSQGFLSNKRKYVDYVKTTLFLVTQIAHKKFLIYKAGLEKLSSNNKSREISEYSNAMVRLYNMFDGCYSSGRLDFSLVENVILNLQVDAALKRNRGFIDSVGMQSYFNFSSLGNEMSKYIFALKKSMLSSRYVPDFEFEDLVRFFRSFPFLLDAKAEYYDMPYSSVPLRGVRLYINGECLDMGHMIAEFNEQVFYLYNISMSDPRSFSDDNMTKEQLVSAEYVSYCKSGEFQVVFSNSEIKEKMPRTVFVVHNIAIENLLREMRLLNVPGKNEINFFKDFFFVDNKYIKYLALTISDLINTESKRKVYDHYKKDYEEVFFRLSGGSQIFRWDEIFVFLLIEVGIYKLLLFLFKNTNLSYSEVKEAFRLRFGESVSRLEQEYDIIRNPRSGLLKNQNNIINCKVQALIMLATRLLTASEVKISVNDSLVSIPEILDDAKEVFRNDALSDDEKILYLANNVVNFNSFIVVFYEGLLRCYEKVRMRDLEESARLLFSAYENTFDTEDAAFFRQATLQVRRHISSNCSEMYKITVLNDDALKKIRGIVKQSFSWLRDFNESLNRRNTNKNEQFYDMVGRRKLFDEETFDLVSKNFTATLDKCAENREKSAALYKAFVRYLEYMFNGSEEANAPVEGAIYPVVGICSKTVMSQDGYRYSYLSVNAGSGENPIEIKIISNENLIVGDVYYCVPNIKRCLHVKDERNGEKYIWISPQTIPYKAFLPNTDAVFGELNGKEDYEKAARLIYYSDERVYRKMFGSCDNAVKVLSVLFDTSNSVYNKRYVKVLRVSDESSENGSKIVAAATLYPELPEWDGEVLTSAFRVAGVPVTEDTRLAMESVSDTFNDTIGNNYYVSDICVDEKYRGNGYAKFLLNNLVRVAEKDIQGKNIVLAVYEDNYVALNLYNSAGFIPYVAGYDNRGEEKTRKEKYYKMIKYI